MKKSVSVLILFIIFAFCLAGLKTYMAITHPVKYKNEILSYANEFNIQPEIIASVINIESSFNKNAYSNKKAIGLMQIKLDTANYLSDLNLKPQLTEKELFQPNINIKYGCMYLRYLLNKFDSLETALCAYNAGETRVRSWLKSDFSSDGKTLDIIPYDETKNYIIKFNKNLKYYKKIFN